MCCFRSCITLPTYLTCSWQGCPSSLASFSVFWIFAFLKGFLLPCIRIRWFSSSRMYPFQYLRELCIDPYWSLKVLSLFLMEIVVVFSIVSHSIQNWSSSKSAFLKSSMKDWLFSKTTLDITNSRDNVFRFLQGTSFLHFNQFLLLGLLASGPPNRLANACMCWYPCSR